MKSLFATLSVSALTYFRGTATKVYIEVVRTNENISYFSVSQYFVSDMFFQQISKILIDKLPKILIRVTVNVQLCIAFKFQHFTFSETNSTLTVVPLKRDVFELATLKMCSAQSSGLISVCFNGLYIVLILILC